MAQRKGIAMPRSGNRISERELVIPSLELAAARPDGYISTTDLIDELTRLFQPAGVDAQILAGRNDTYFSQKVRNMISHRNSSGSFIAQGYAEYTGDGIRITPMGRTRLRGRAA